MMASKSFTFRFTGYEVRERELRLSRAGEPLPVEPKAFRVLICLLRTPGLVVSKEELLRAVWGETAVTDNSLTRAIALLRRLLADDPHDPRYIETVATVGYRFICQVEVIEDSTGKPEVENPPAPGLGGEAPATPVSAVVPSVVADKTKAHGRRRLWLSLGATGVLAALAMGYLYLRRPLPPPRITGYDQITNDDMQKGLLGGTDGNRLYLSLEQPLAIAQISTSGGPLAQIPVDLPALSVRDVSPDGSSLLGLVHLGGDQRDTELWVVGIQGHPVRHLAKALDAAWSPNGQFVTYAFLGNIYSIRSDGTDSRLLAPSAGPAGEYQFTSGLSWSPDGTTIRFARGRELWEVSSNGSNLRQLLPGWQPFSMKCCGRWTSDGQFYVFMSGAERTPWLSGGQLWAIDERRGLLRPPIAQPIQLTSGPIRWDAPVPSRDGQKIFARGVTLRGELVRYDKDSGQFKPYLGGLSADFVAYSKDGKSVAYVSFPDGILWRVNLDGTGLTQLSQPPLYPKAPRWSPDGTQILFTALQGNGMDAMYTVSSVGGAPGRILPEETLPQSDPTWSPEGKRVAYSSANVAVWGLYGKSDLRILDLTRHRITPIPGSESLFSPRWSPDGRYIAALSIISNQDLRVFDTETQRWMTIQKGPINFPNWSQDSRSIFCLGAPPDQPVLRVPIDGGQAERVVDFKGYRQTGWYGSWLGLDASDAPLLLHDVGVDEIYALPLERK